MKTRSPRAGQVNLFDLLMLVLLVLSALTGLYWGIELGSAYGFLGRPIGGVLGAAAGVIGAVLVTLTIFVASEPFDRFWRWWRPYPPACENGTCAGQDDYSRCEIPEDVVRRVRSLARFGKRCRCGNIYGGGCDYPLLNRWVRVLPEGTVRPYLRHRPFGRWIRDETNVVAKASEPKRPRPSIKIPRWVVPVALAVISGGMAAKVAYIGPHATADPIRPWFVLACAALGLGLGCVALFWKTTADAHENASSVNSSQPQSESPLGAADRGDVVD